MPPPTSAWMRIGELSLRTGVNPELLRAWERRYRLLRPRRTSGGTRMYASTDEARVRLMRRYLDEGLPPAQAVEMVTAARLSVRRGKAAGSIPPAEVAEAHVEMHASLDRFDETSAQRALERLFGTYPASTVIRDATNIMHAQLLAFARGWDRGLGPRALLACAPGEQHTFGIIGFGVALHQRGWRITYLGAVRRSSTTFARSANAGPRRSPVPARQ